MPSSKEVNMDMREKKEGARWWWRGGGRWLQVGTNPLHSTSDCTSEFKGIGHGHEREDEVVMEEGVIAGGNMLGFLVKMVYEINIIPHFDFWQWKLIKVVPKFIHRKLFWYFRKKFINILVMWSPFQKYFYRTHPSI